MIDYDKLDSLMKLPVPEEMVGAYLEGNLTAEDSSMVQGIIDSNSEFRNFVEDVSVADPSTEESIYDTHPNFDLDFELPEVPLQFEPQTRILFLKPFIAEMEYQEIEACACCAEKEIIIAEDESIFEETDDFTSNSAGETPDNVDEEEFMNDNIKS